MALLVLTPGQIYNLKVVSFTNRNKTFEKKSENRWYDSYHVKVEDYSGNSVMCEYVTPAGTCADCFVVGVGQYIKCLFVSPKGTPEIEPTDEPGKLTGPGIKQLDKNANPPREENQDANAYLLSISGKSITFALAYAKDIMIAEIGQQAFGVQVTEEQIDRMFAWADKINGYLNERVNF